MSTTDVHFSCGTLQWDLFLEMCGQRGVEPGPVLSDMVRIKVRNWDREDAGRKILVDELELRRIRLAVSSALQTASDWTSLQFELDKSSLAYHPSGSGLVMINSSTGEVYCMASQIGPNYFQMVKLFQSGFPGHPRPWLAEEILGMSQDPLEAKAAASS